MQFVRLLLAIVFPPAAVFFTYGISFALVVNIGLTLLGWVPGVIHALWILTKGDDNTD
jgi:uncharacterized membrane protein YqaE (UPF0057 family)